MRADNPAAKPCESVEKGPEHDWLKIADGTARCTRCGKQMRADEVKDAWPPETQVNKAAAGEPVAAKKSAKK